MAALGLRARRMELAHARSARQRIDRFTVRAAMRAGVSAAPPYDYVNSLRRCTNSEVVRALRRAVRRSV